ncbi:MAG TPA: ATP-binding cassette domain-containing protein, partial [Sinomonas sp.]|nr:ATP-binding cassette domain-containing protein [Sinomonas sp.]
MSSVDIVNVHKSFGDNEILKGVDLQVRQGEVVCLLGPSGSGKSTLLRCINGLVMPDKGHVSVGGALIGRKVQNGKLHDLNGKEAAVQRKRIGMVFQQFNLFPHLDVRDNLMLGPRALRLAASAELEEKARHILAKVGLANRSGAYPSQLSGGQQQRVAIARALMMAP